MARGGPGTQCLAMRQVGGWWKLLGEILSPFSSRLEDVCVFGQLTHLQCQAAFPPNVPNAFPVMLIGSWRLFSLEWPLLYPHPQPMSQSYSDFWAQLNCYLFPWNLFLVLLNKVIISAPIFPQHIFYIFFLVLNAVFRWSSVCASLLISAVI